MFTQLNKEITALEYMLSGLVKEGAPPPVTPSEIGGFVDAFVEVRALTVRLKQLETHLGDKLRDNFVGALQSNAHGITISASANANTVQWQKVAGELSAMVPPSAFERALSLYSTSSVRRPSVRVEY